MTGQNEAVEVNFEVHLTSNEVKRTKNEGVLRQNETVDE